MSAGTIIILLLLGLAAGLLSSMVGIGGGIVIVPALVLILGLDQKTAQGTSLAMLLPPIGILGVMAYYRSGNVKLEYALLLCATFIIGSWLGAQWVKNLNTITIKKVFAIFMIAVAVKYLFFDKPKTTGAPPQESSLKTGTPASKQ